MTDYGLIDIVVFLLVLRSKNYRSPDKYVVACISLRVDSGASNLESQYTTPVYRQFVF